MLIPAIAIAGVLLFLILLTIFVVYRRRRTRHQRIERVMHTLSVDFGYIELVGGLRGKQREGAMGKYMAKNLSIDAGRPEKRRTGNWELAMAMAQDFVLTDGRNELPPLPVLPPLASIPGIRISDCSTLAGSEMSFEV